MTTDNYSDSLFVRIHPVNPGRGHRTRRCLYKGNLYRVERGWYKVSKELGEEIADLKANPYSIGAPNIFQVCTFEEARDIQKEETLANDPRRIVRDAVDIAMSSATSVETSKPKKRKASKEAPKKVKKKVATKKASSKKSKKTK